MFSSFSFCHCPSFAAAGRAMTGTGRNLLPGRPGFESRPVNRWHASGSASSLILYKYTCLVARGKLVFWPRIFTDLHGLKDKKDSLHHEGHEGARRLSGRRAILANPLNRGFRIEGSPVLRKRVCSCRASLRSAVRNCLAPSQNCLAGFVLRQISDFRCQMPDTRYQIPNVRSQRPEERRGGELKGNKV